MKKILALLMFLILLIGCGMRQQPEEVAVEKAVVYSADFPTVWTTVISILADCNLPVDNMERDSGFVNCKAFDVPREWLNAPEEGIDYRLRNCEGVFNVFVTEVEGGCKVSITSSYTALVWKYNLLLGTFEREESFLSSGVFEQHFHSLLSDRLSL